MAGRIMAKGEAHAESALGFAGYYIGDDFSPQYGTNLGYVAVTLPATNKRRFDDYPENDVIRHLEVVRELLGPYVPEGFSLSVRPEKDGPPTGKDLNIRILGNNTQSVEGLSKTIERFIRGNTSVFTWLEGLSDDQGSEARVMRMRIDSQKAAEHNLTVAEVAAVGAAVVEGTIAAEMKLPEKVIDIRLATRRRDEPVRDDLLDLAIAETPGGRSDSVMSVSLSTVLSRGT